MFFWLPLFAYDEDGLLDAIVPAPLLAVDERWALSTSLEFMEAPRGLNDLDDSPRDTDSFLDILTSYFVSLRRIGIGYVWLIESSYLRFFLELCNGLYVWVLGMKYFKSSTLLSACTWA